MQTILIQDHLRQSYYHNEAKKHNGIVKGVNLISLNNLFHVTSAKHQEALLLTCAKRLQANKDNYPIYAPMFLFPSFINEVVTFAKELALYHVPTTQLPTNTPANKELKAILEDILTYDLVEHKQYAMQEEVLTKLLNTENLSIHERFDTNYFHHQFLEQLLTKKPELEISYQHNEAQTKELRCALSMRQEIEAIAQDIIKKNTPANIILCSYKNQYPVLKQVFTRYNIPFSSIHETKPLHASTIFVNLASVALFKTSDALVEAIATNCFNKSVNSDLLQFIQTVMVEPGKILDFSTLDDTMFKREKDHYLDMAARATSYMEEIHEDLNRLLQSKTPNEALQNAYTIFQTNRHLANNDELNLAKSIRSALNDALPLVETKEDAIFLLRRIDAMKVKLANYHTDFIMVTDLTHVVSPQETTYIVGCNAKSYPGMPLRNGLFDETYTKEITSLPSLEKRHTLYMSQLNWIKHSANHLVYSYYTNDYQGKEVQLSFHIESMFKENDDLTIKPFHLLTTQPTLKPIHQLDSDLAKELFFEEGKINSSISRVERFFHCPFSYFIQSGLKVDEFSYAQLDAATAGKIQHAFMEQIVNEKGKDYVNTTKEEIESLVEPHFNDLLKLQPHQQAEINLTKKRMVSSLYDSLIFLKAYEQTTAFKTTETEHWFNFALTDEISMHGVIDRIDTYNDQFHVIDYKSSAKRLSDSEVRRGLQLQLLTYLVAYKETSNLTAGGAYYYSFGNPSCQLGCGTFSKSKGIHMTELTEEILYNTYINNRRMTGWPFAMDDLTDDEYKMLYDPTQRTDTSMYNYDTTKEALIEIYETFARKLKEGNIAVSPSTNACTFCKYKSICAFKGKPKDPDFIISEKLKGAF